MNVIFFSNAFSLSLIRIGNDSISYSIVKALELPLCNLLVTSKKRRNQKKNLLQQCRWRHHFAYCANKTKHGKSSWSKKSIPFFFSSSFFATSISNAQIDFWSQIDRYRCYWWMVVFEHLLFDQILKKKKINLTSSTMKLKLLIE